MAMNGNTLGTAIHAAVTGLPAGNMALPIGDAGNLGTDLDPVAVWQAIGGAIVSHIQTAATVLIKNTDAGLQLDNTGGNPPTLAPATTQTLPGGAIQ